MSTVRLWRFEVPNGDGIYVSAAADNAGIPRAYSEQHPDPEEDGALRCLHMWRYKFAFAAFEDVVKWLYQPEWYAALEKEGVMVHELEIGADAARLGKGQAMYDYKHASLRYVRSYKPTVFLDMITS